MKHFLTVLMLLCGYMLCKAQATSLTVDNQPPGWLSSKINYGDQITLKNLKVTGYINGTDINFILDLSNRRVLRGVLDLSEAHIVAGVDKVNNTSVEDEIWSSAFCKSEYPFKKVILPKSLRKKYEYGSDGSANADTIIIPTPFDRYLRIFNCNNNLEPKPFYSIPDGVEELNEINNIKVALPKSCRKIHYGVSNSTIYAPWENPTIDALYYVYSTGGGIYRYPTGIIYVPDGSTERYKSSDFKKMDIREYGNIELVFGTNNQRIYTNDTIPLNYEIKGWKEEVGWIDVKSDYQGAEVDLDANHIVFKNAGRYNVTLTPHSAIPYFNTIGNTCTFDVFEHATSVEIPSELKIGVGESAKLSAIVQPEGKAFNEVTWVTSDISVASVDSDGLVKAKSKGNCLIIAKSVDGGYTAACKVTVMQPVESVTICTHKLDLNVRTISQLTAKVLPSDAYDILIVWSSSDPSIATVTNNGKVTAIAPGSAKIYATSNYNPEIKDVCEVTVLQPATGISLDRKEVELEEEESVQLHASVLPANASNKDVTWTSSDISIAMISPNGTVYGIKPGQATIMATAVDGGFVDLCKVIVKAKTVTATSLKLSTSSETLCIGKTLQLTAIIDPENVSDKTINWTSTDTKVATVDSSGLVSALSEGNTQIIASTTDGSNLSAICEITVENKSGIESIIADKDSSVKVYNLTGYLIFEGRYSDAKLMPGFYIISYNGKNYTAKID